MSNKESPLVSVIIPTYKRSDYLIRALNSVLMQSYSNIEIVIVDDNDPGSEYRKKTKEKINNYKDLAKIQYIENLKNLGGALARNEGIKAAQGEYVAFLDDDDIFLKDKIKHQMEFMLLNKLDLSFSNVAIVNEKGKIIDFREHSYLKSMDNSYLLKNHLMYHLTPTGTYIFDKKALIKIGGFVPAAVGQEFRLMLKALTENLKVGYFDETNLIQFVHSGERISVGQNKIEGEKELLELKKTYFNILDKDEQKYVLFRYRAMLSFVGIRSKKPIFAASNLVRAFAISPKYFFKEMFGHGRKINMNWAKESLINDQITNLYQA